MLADPALDLSDPAERAESGRPVALPDGSDAGRLGMDQLVSNLRGRPD